MQYSKQWVQVWSAVLEYSKQLGQVRSTVMESKQWSSIYKKYLHIIFDLLYLYSSDTPWFMCRFFIQSTIFHGGYCPDISLGHYIDIAYAFIFHLKVNRYMSQWYYLTLRANNSIWTLTERQVKVPMEIPIRFLTHK